MRNQGWGHGTATTVLWTKTGDFLKDLLLALWDALLGFFITKYFIFLTWNQIFPGHGFCALCFPPNHHQKLVRGSRSKFLNKKGSQVLLGLNTIQKIFCLPLRRNSHFPEKIFQSFMTTPQAYFLYLSGRWSGTTRSGKVEFSLLFFSPSCSVFVIFTSILASFSGTLELQKMTWLDSEIRSFLLFFPNVKIFFLFSQKMARIVWSWGSVRLLRF